MTDYYRIKVLLSNQDHSAQWDTSVIKDLKSLNWELEAPLSEFTIEHDAGDATQQVEG